MSKTIDDVKRFWEENPLWAGESGFRPGTLEYFQEHLRVVTEDCYAGTLDERMFPPPGNRDDVLDLGCGPGVWIIELARRGCARITGADLTENALRLAQRRCELFGVAAQFSRQNAEHLTFANESFTHVNCQGVIHHTPDTTACVREIARVLRPGGTASVSVYYRNVFLRCWPLIRPLGRALARRGAALKGRGREGIYGIDDVDELVRLYDGVKNPIGKSYTQRQFRALLEPHFKIERTFLHFFPARTLPFRLAPALHRWLDRNAGFLIYASLRKH